MVVAKIYLIMFSQVYNANIKSSLSITTYVQPSQKHCTDEICVIFIKSYVSGTFTQTSAEGYENVLKALNVGFMLRQAALASTPIMTISEAGGRWSIITKTSMKSLETNFRLGEEFEEVTTDGRKCKTTVIMEGNKIITNQKAINPGGKDVLVVSLAYKYDVFCVGNMFFQVREFDDEGIDYTITVGSVESRQRFTRS